MNALGGVLGEREMPKPTKPKSHNKSLPAKLRKLENSDALQGLESALTYSLILYILAHSRVPMSSLLKGLGRIESNAAEVISTVLTDKMNNTISVKQINGFLRGSVSMILMLGSLRPKPTPKRNVPKYKDRGVPSHTSEKRR
ncbi:MAG: hypothetical protein ACLGGX_08505 [Bdellovibrionia bacterium]